MGSLLRNPTLVVQVQLQLREKLICFSILILNFVWKADEGETESSVLLIFVLQGFLNSRWVRGGEVGAESLIQGQLKSHLFPAGILAKATSMTHSDMFYRLDISTFYFYESLLLQIFFPWKYIKTSLIKTGFPCLLSLLQSTAMHITISINIFICFKYYALWNQFFFN